MTCEIKRSTLSDANQRRSAQCFFWILQQLTSILPRKIRKEIKKVVKILDSSPIQLRGNGYDEWAKEHAINRCQGLKLHVEYDLEIESPTKVAMSYPNYHDCSMGRNWPIISDAVYVFDKGYYDFNWWWSIHQKGAFFVTRLKKNAGVLIQENNEHISETILEDSVIKFKHKRSKGSKINQYRDNSRRVSVYREGKGPLILVTNLFDVPAKIIAELYKARWEVELFFKWIKQNLRLKKFLGKSENAVKIQIATAIITYLLVWLYKHNSNESRRLQLVLIWIRCNLNIVEPKFKNGTPPIYHVIEYRKGVHL
jgi:putative transposase